MRSRQTITYCVWVDWTGERFQVQPFIEALAGIRSAGSGSFLAVPLNDVSFEFRSAYDARHAFDRIKAVGPRWAGYIRIRLMQIPPGLDAVWKQLRIYKRGTAPSLESLTRKARTPKSPRVIHSGGKRQHKKQLREAS